MALQLSLPGFKSPCCVTSISLPDLSVHRQRKCAAWIFFGKNWMSGGGECVCKQPTEAALVPGALSQGQSTESTRWDSTQRQLAFGWPRLGQGCILVRADSPQPCFDQTPPGKRCQVALRLEGGPHPTLSPSSVSFTGSVPRRSLALSG